MILLCHIVTMSRSKRITNSELRITIAKVISRFFDPVWIIPAMLAGAAAWSLYNGLRWRFIVILFLFDGLIPFIYFVHLLKIGEISDWDTTKRTQRFRLYGFVILIHASGVVFTWILGKIILAKILFAFWMLALAFGLVTLFWKISIHTGVSSAAIAFLIILIGPRMAWLFILVLLIGWARVVTKKHSWSQALAGMILAPALLLIIFTLLGVDQTRVNAPSQQGYFAPH